MTKKLAIRGHRTRGNEVIELLEMMGGVAAASKGFRESYCYYVSENTDPKYISWDYIGPEEIDKYKIFTLEEFLEKYPFKVGDNVRMGELWTPIRGMKWDPIQQEVNYLVNIWYTVKELMNWNAEVPVGEEKNEEITKDRNKRLLDQLYENGLKAMFKEHDIVTVVAKGGRSRWICEYKSAKVDQLSYYKGTYVVTGDDYKEDLMYDSNYDISPTDTIRPATPGEVTLFERLVRKIEKPNTLAELLEHIKTTSKEDLEKEFEEIKEWSNVGPTFEEFRAFCESVNREPKYPTTYAECCKVLRKNPDIKPEICMVSPEESLLFSKLIILKRCRDAYWKIYGEEMGLSKPWEPDWSTEHERKYVIEVYRNNARTNSQGYSNTILAFPTAEMRDAFYENFEGLIEQCKELL